MYSADRETEPEVPAKIGYSAQDRRRLAERVRSGDLERIRPGVLMVPIDDGLRPHEVSELVTLRTVRAVVERSRSSLWVSHQTALLLHGCWTFQSGTAVHVTHLSNPNIDHEHETDIVRHWTKLPDRDRSTVGGIPVTTLERSLVDSIRSLKPDSALVAADSAFRRGASTVLVQRIVAESVGKRGVVQARETLRHADPRSGSPGESIVRAAMHRARDVNPSLQIPVKTRIGTFWVDVGWPDLKVGFEFDGAVKYSGGAFGDPELAQRERARRVRALEEAGWLIFEVKWADVEDPARLDALVYDAFLLGLAHMRRAG